MKITLLFFASLREALGVEREELALPPEVTTAAELRSWLTQRGGAWSEQLREGRAVRVAVDRQMAGSDARLDDGAEVAFFPPVTGG